MQARRKGSDLACQTVAYLRGARGAIVWAAFFWGQ